MRAFILILLFSFIISCTRLEREPSCFVEDIAFFASDGYAMDWECLPDSLKDGELSMGWQGMTDTQRRGKLIVFAVYTNGPFEGRAYRPCEDDDGFYIVRDGKKVYLGAAR